MRFNGFKRLSIFLVSLIVMAWAWLGFSGLVHAQIQCPPADGGGSSRDYGTACGNQMVILGGTMTPYAMSGSRVPGDDSLSIHRILASSGSPYTTRLPDDVIRELIRVGTDKLTTQWLDLRRFFDGPALEYQSAALQFINSILRQTEEAHNYFLAAVMADPENTAAVNGLLDTMELLSTGWIIQGNEQLVEAVYRRYRQSGFDIFQINRGLREAEQSFRTSVAVYMRTFYLPLSRGRFPTVYDLVLDYQRNRSDYTNMAFKDLRLLARVAGRKAFTRRELGTRLFALRNFGEAFDVLTRAELEIVGEMLLISPIYLAIRTETERVAVNEALRELLAERNQITTLLRYLEGGKNVFGLDTDYVPFRFDREIHDPDRFTNFTQVRRWAEDRVNDARASYDAFLRQQRDFDASVVAYRRQVQQHQDFYNRELSLLCGAADPPPAGCPGGTIREARGGIDSANLRIEAALQEIDNLQSRIRNMIEASDAIRAIREQLALMEIANGQQRATLTQELSRLQADAARERAELEYRRLIDLSRLPGADQTAGRIAGDAARAAGGIDERLQRQQGELQAQIERLQALQRAEFSRVEDRQRQVEVQRFVKDTTLDIISRRIELRMAQLSLTQAMATLDDRNQQLRRLLTERKVWDGLVTAGDPVFRDPTLRIIRDDWLKRYMEDYEEAQRRVYLTGRALGYETNVCPGTRCLPEVASLDDVLSVVDVEMLRRQLTRLNDARVTFETGYRPERRRLVLELSKLLGFRTRRIGGEELNYKQQFVNCLRAQLPVAGGELPPGCSRFQMADPDPVTGLYRTVTFRFNIDLGIHLQDFQDPDFTPILPPALANIRLRFIKAYIQGPTGFPGRFAMLPLSYGQVDPATGNLIGTMMQRGVDSNITFLDFTGRDFIRRYNAIGAGKATLEAAVGGDILPSFDRISPSSDRFIYRTLGLINPGYILELSVDPRRAPPNPELIESLSTVEDIHFEFTCDALTL